MNAPLEVVAQSLKLFRLLARYKQMQQLPTLLAKSVGSCCIRLHPAQVVVVAAFL